MRYYALFLLKGVCLVIEVGYHKKRKNSQLVILSFACLMLADTCGH